MQDHIERLFLRTLEKLHESVTTRDPITALDASLHIRKLLIDGHPLVDQVNRMRGFKLVFQVTEPLDPGWPAGLIQKSLMDGIDPDTCPPHVPRLAVNRDGLLSYLIHKSAGHNFTIREIVLFEANIMGAVHADAPREEKLKALQRMNEFIGDTSDRASLYQLRGVGRVILKGLDELRQAVAADVAKREARI